MKAHSNLTIDGGILAKNCAMEEKFGVFARAKAATIGKARTRETLAFALALICSVRLI